MDARISEGRHFISGRALPARDDRACVSHAPAGGRGLARDKTDHGLVELGFDVRGGFLFRSAPDFPDHDHGVRVRVVPKEHEAVREGRADDRISANAHAGRLPKPGIGELRDRLVRERAAARNHADAPLAVNRAGHNADFALARGNQPRTIRADQARGFIRQVVFDFEHVQNRDVLGNAHDQRQARIGGLHNGVRSKGRGNEIGRCRGTGLCHRFGDRVKHRHPIRAFAALARVDHADDLSAVFHHLLQMKPRLAPHCPAAGKCLDDHAGVAVNENAHKVFLVG